MIERLIMKPLATVAIIGVLPGLPRACRGVGGRQQLIGSTIIVSRYGRLAIMRFGLGQYISGSGIGLTIAKALVQAHQGKI